MARIQISEGIKQGLILEAEGRAQAILIEAQANAERIQLLADAIRANPDLLTLEFIQAWNGQFPQMYLSSDKNDLSMLLNIPASDLRAIP